ncbi:hypothetical protein ACIP5T_05990 [Microbacterium sp. NPDC088619]|uniref:hypothetical protein n=1 Tax=Microbacterium sp. NPDC088619 TaxID=3364196 RepID=UPI0037F84E81
MNRGLTWAIGGAAAALLVVGAASWLWLSSSDVPPVADPTATSGAPTPENDERTAAQQALDDHLEECTSAEVVDDAVPDGCGIRIPWGTEFAAVDDVRFRIEQLPVLELTDGGFVADGGILVATVSGTGQDGSPRTETYRTESWTLRGGVTVEGDDVKLDVW